MITPTPVLRLGLFLLYVSECFTKSLITISGARVGFQGNPSGQIRRLNHSSAFAHPEIITESIQNELQKGRVKQISDLPQDLFCPQPALPQNKRTAFNRDGESYFIRILRQRRHSQRIWRIYLRNSQWCNSNGYLECPPFQLIRVEMFFPPFRVLVESDWRPIEDVVSGVCGSNFQWLCKFSTSGSRRLIGHNIQFLLDKWSARWDCKVLKGVRRQYYRHIHESTTTYDDKTFEKGPSIVTSTVRPLENPGIYDEYFRRFVRDLPPSLTQTILDRSDACHHSDITYGFQLFIIPKTNFHLILHLPISHKDPSALMLLQSRKFRSPFRSYIQK